MANFSDFLPAAGGALTNTYAALSIMENTPGWDSANNIYTDENGGVWLRTGYPLDATTANKLLYPKAGFKNFSYATLSAANPAVNRQYQGNGIIYDWNDPTNVTSYRVYGSMRYTYNSTYGWMDWQYGSSSGAIYYAVSSPYAQPSTPQPFGFNPSQPQPYKHIARTVSGTDASIVAFNNTNNTTSGTNIGTYTGKWADDQNRVGGCHYVDFNANSDIRVYYTDNNVFKLDTYTWGGSSYSLSTTDTLAMTSNDVTVPYTGNMGTNFAIEKNSNGGFCVLWNSYAVVYSDADTITSVRANVTMDARSRAIGFTDSYIAVGSGNSVRSYKDILGDTNTVSQSVITGSADNLYIFKKIG